MFFVAYCSYFFVSVRPTQTKLCCVSKYNNDFGCCTHGPISPPTYPYEIQVDCILQLKVRILLSILGIKSPPTRSLITSSFKVVLDGRRFARLETCFLLVTVRIFLFPFDQLRRKHPANHAN